MASCEEKVERLFKNQLEGYGVKFFFKTESINSTIDEALRTSESKSGGKGNNYPDIKVLLQTSNKTIPVMIEAKGTKGALIKLDKNNAVELVTTYTSDSKNKAGEIIHQKGDPNYSTITKYALNGAVHYANAIIKYKDKLYDDVLAIGINGFEEDGTQDFVTEIEVYLISARNYFEPKRVGDFKDLSFLKDSNKEQFIKNLETLFLTEEEKENLKLRKEIDLEKIVKEIHQSLYDDRDFKTTLQTNDKLYLFTGLIMACLDIEGVASLELSALKGEIDDPENTDGAIILKRIKRFLKSKNHINTEKTDMVLRNLTGAFSTIVLNTPHNGESYLKKLFKKVKNDVMPCLIPELHVDFTGKIFNSLNDWVQIENDKYNDVVLTPHYITKFMAKLARTNKDSFVWDSAMGSAGFLISAMELMIQDAKDKIKKF